MLSLFSFAFSLFPVALSLYRHNQLLSATGRFESDIEVAGGFANRSDGEFERGGVGAALRLAQDDDVRPVRGGGADTREAAAPFETHDDAARAAAVIQRQRVGV